MAQELGRKVYLEYFPVFSVALIEQFSGNCHRNKTGVITGSIILAGTVGSTNKKSKHSHVTDGKRGKSYESHSEVNSSSAVSFVFFMCFEQV